MIEIFGTMAGQECPGPPQARAAEDGGKSLPSAVTTLGPGCGVHDPEQAERFAVWVVAAGELVEQGVQAVGKLASYLWCEP